MDKHAPSACPSFYDEVLLQSLVQDAALQVRHKGLNARTVEQYRVAVRHAQQGAAPLPPITVGRVDSILYVVDGFHRTKAHELEGLPTIAANVVDVATIAEAKWLAAHGNLVHGLPLVRKDRREAFRRFIRAGVHKKAHSNVSRQLKAGRPAPGMMSLREIAASVGISKSSCRNWLSADFPRIYHQLYRNDGDTPPNDGANLEPYAPYREENPASLAMQSLVNLGAAIEGLSDAHLPDLVHGIAAVIESLTKRHGQERLQAAYDAGWNEGWHYSPPIIETDF